MRSASRLCSRTVAVGWVAMALLQSLPGREGEIKASVPAQMRGPIARQGLPPHVEPERAPQAAAAEEGGASPAAAAVLACDRVQDWLLEECNDYRGMRVRRPLACGEMQRQVDLLALYEALGQDEAVGEAVRVAQLASSEGDVAAEWAAAARRLVRQVGSPGLPEDLSLQIQRDIEEVGVVMAKLLPNAEDIKLKLELMGENSCSRWHQDSYTCRAIITYNGWGTVYTEHDNVDFWELKNCGNNDCILRDSSQVWSAECGDVLLMKGKLFPSPANGLVHKSPERRYQSDGNIMNRLCLKFDVA